MTLKEAYEYGRERLNAAGIEECSVDAWYLLEFVTGLDRTAYFLKPDEKITDEQDSLYKAYLEQRAQHIPLQHITGVQEFMGLEFAVNEHVLVPRQDTETLVECVLSYVQPQMKVLDMCTGSGCILISLMKLGKIAQGVGADISDEALKTAKKNAEKHQVEPLLIKSDLFENIVDKYDEECSMSVRMKFEKILNLLKKWNIDYSAYNIEGVSHLYALWYLALYIDNNQIDADDICDKMNIFYRNLRSDKTIPQTVIYQQSMQSASRSSQHVKKGLMLY